MWSSRAVANFWHWLRSSCKGKNTFSCLLVTEIKNSYFLDVFGGTLADSAAPPSSRKLPLFHRDKRPSPLFIPPSSLHTHAPLQLDVISLPLPPFVLFFTSLIDGREGEFKKASSSTFILHSRYSILLAHVCPFSPLCLFGPVTGLSACRKLRGQTLNEALSSSPSLRWHSLGEREGGGSNFGMC